MTTTNCSRCKGKGYGDWVVQNGVCFACGGSGRREDQLESQRLNREFNDGTYARKIEEAKASVLIHADNRRDASYLLATGFQLNGVLPHAEELAPGWYVFLVHGGANWTLEQFVENAVDRSDER